MKRIFLVDDHPISRDGIAGLISRQDDLEVCGEAGSAEEALEFLATDRPDVIITDINLPGKNGLELIKDVQAMYPKLPMIALSMHDETLYAERVLRASGRGYLMKETKPANLVKAIRLVLDGGIYLSEAMTKRMLELVSGNGGKLALSPMERLTDREFEVFQLIGQGRASKEIAGQLNISARTVDAHRTHIKEKLNLKSGSELNRHAVRWVESENPS
ncbi:response regulator transcription factor (plasmid) [Verrucomicrobiaceae bacterium 227]